jgi:mannitol/fructose-specific phosphotransferase system IIA component (Ntr-type)
VAIPHAKVKGLKETLVVFGRSLEGIDFDCPDNVPSNLIFLMLVPEDQGARHLQLLSELARFFHKADRRKALIEATTAEEICQIFDSAVTS